MIRWCAYCQTYQGEKAPYEDYSVTHTICDACAAPPSFEAKGAKGSLEPIRSLFSRLSHPAPGDTPQELLATALRLGIAPIDLLLGLVQPVLYEVGALWSRGEATVEHEHEVTRRCFALYDALLDQRPELRSLRTSSRPAVVLTCSPGNAHCLGLRILELYLMTEGFSVHVASSDASVSELVELTRDMEPQVLGVSVALTEQLPNAIELAARVAELQPRRRTSTVVGGRALHRSVAFPSDAPLRAIDDFRALPDLLRGPSSGHSR